MKREKFAWLVSIVLMALLAFQLPNTLARRDDDYAFVRTLIDIHRQVVDHYVQSVDEKKLEQGAIDGMLDQLDPYTVYFPPSREKSFETMIEGNFVGIGIEIDQTAEGRIRIAEPIDGSPAFEAGIQPGDIILEVDSKPVAGMRIADVAKLISGRTGTQVTLRVRHPDGQEANITMTRRQVIVPTIKGYQREPDNSWKYFVCDKPKIAYVRITQFTPDTYEKLRPTLENLLHQGMQGLILDLRWNPGGHLDQATEIVDLFIDHGTIISTKGRNSPEHVYTATAQGTLPYFPMIVLVNEDSASAAEIVSGSLQDNHRATLVGTRTYGKGSVQDVIPLEGDSGILKLTVAYYYLPSGRLVNRTKGSADWGVDPKIVVPMDQAQQKGVIEQMYQRELVRGTTAIAAPVTRAAEGAAAGAATKSATNAATRAATQPAHVVDVQLQTAIETLIGQIVYHQSHPQENPETEAPAATQTMTEIAPHATTRQ